MESEPTLTAKDAILVASNTESTQSKSEVFSEDHIAISATAPGGFKVIRRNGKVTGFDSTKIKVAITKAFIAVEGQTGAASTRIHKEVEKITDQVVAATTRHLPNGGAIHIEDIQDQVELALMRAGQQKVARSYVLYREQRAEKRAKENAPILEENKDKGLNVKQADGSTIPLDERRLRTVITESCEGIEGADGSAVFDEMKRSLFEGVAETDVANAATMSARTFIEKEPNYTYVAARLLLDNLRREALSFLNNRKEEATQKEIVEIYPTYFEQYIKRAIDLELMDPRLGNYDLKKLGEAIAPERDFNFNYLGLQTLYDRYFLKEEDIRIELPQAFFMRVAMGLAINEIDTESWTIKFYNLLSSFDFMIICTPSS